LEERDQAAGNAESLGMSLEKTTSSKWNMKFMKDLQTQ
jgi:hypothetical protein